MNFFFHFSMLLFAGLHKRAPISVPASYLGLSAGHQVFELKDFVINRGPVALFDGVVSRALLPLVRLADRLAADGNAIDGQLVSIHHDGHRGQDGATTHKGLRR